MNRREFIKTAAATTAIVQMSGVNSAIGENASSSNPAKIPTREFGKTGVQLSIIGFGGIVVTNAEQTQANRDVAEAVERGVNYFDVAPGYGDAEIKLGPALEPYRKSVFLACKTGERTREKAEFELARSLERLRTDHLELYQLHGLVDVQKDCDVAFGKGGAMEVFIEAKKQGKVKYLGFSAHTVEAAFAAMDRYDFDSILFPINFACYSKGDFGPQIMERAVSKNVARLALKAMARQHWPDKDPLRKRYGKCWYQPLADRHEAELGLRFTLSQPITAAIPPGETDLFRMAMDVAMTFKPIAEKELEELYQLAETLNPIFKVA
jgi:aryl-alcohol dehydrogenase-like predicted oxidoreductase